MKKKTVLLMQACVLSVLLLSCNKSELNTENNVKTISFGIQHYKQYGFEASRAAVPVDLPHLSFAAFDAATGTAVVPTITSNTGDKEYGIFTATFPYGSYQLVFVGYEKDYDCIIDSPSSVSFANSFVPNTFLYYTTIDINEETESQQSITLKRAVAAFRLVINDEIPAEFRSVRFVCDGGGTALNATTGFAKEVVGRTSTVNIPATFKGGENAGILTYLFLPSSETVVNYHVEALDDANNVICSRDFCDVPMKINTITCYSGSFFTEPIKSKTSDYTILYEKEWADTLHFSY